MASWCLGSVVILLGCTVELVYPWLRWLLGRFGKCERAVQRRIKVGESLLSKLVVTRDDLLGWQETTQAVLLKYLGLWHPQFKRFETDGGYEVANQDVDKTVIAKQLGTLRELRKSLIERTVTLAKKP